MMFSAFFGNYLLEKKIVTADELQKALQTQEKTRLKLGILAIHAGYMTAAEVEQVNRLQHREDRLFGELAVELGYLEQNHLFELLQQQKTEQVVLAQALVDKNIMTMEVFEEQLHNYKAEYQLSDEDFEAITNGDIDVIVRAFLNMEKGENADIYREYVGLYVRNLMRFVDHRVRVDRVIKVSEIYEEHFFTQEIIGDMEVFTAYSGDHEGLLKVASEHAENPFEELEEWAIDALKEFLNLANGLFIVNKSDEGMKLSLEVQQYEHETKRHPIKTVYKIPIYLTKGILYLYVGIR